MWIVYFSLAALPLFGLGQLAIPVAQESRRLYAFCLLAIYVASGLGLLLTTSFLGLRRYLRQRRLTMPMIMTGIWVTVGCVLIFGVMGLALLLPRPNAEFAASQAPFVMGSPDQKPSQQALGDEGVKSDKPGRPAPANKDEPAKDAAGKPSDNKPSDKANGDKQDDGKSDSNKQDGNKPGSSKPDGEKQQKDRTANDKAAHPQTTGGPAQKQAQGDKNEQSKPEKPKRDGQPASTAIRPKPKRRSARLSKG